MKKIRVGHLGTKHDHSTGKLDCIRKFPEIFDIIGIAEDDPEQEERAKSNPCYRGLKWMTSGELLDSEPDAVLCEGFEHDLPYDALKCVERGIHVHIDKPAGRDIGVFKDVLSTAKAKWLTVQLAYMYRYNPAIEKCLELVRSGELGKVNCVTAIMNTDHVKAKRGWLSGFQGGNMFFLGCHMCDLVYMMQGVPEKITPFFASSGFGGTASKDVALAVWEYSDGISTVTAASTEAGGFDRRQLVVSGSEAACEIIPLEWPVDLSLTKRRFNPADTYAHNADKRIIPIEPINGSQRYDAMMLDFAAMVRGEKRNPFDYDYEYQLQKLVLASSGFDIDFKSKETL